MATDTTKSAAKQTIVRMYRQSHADYRVINEARTTTHG